MENNIQNGSNTFGVVALVCGILSIVTFWIPWFNIVSLVLGVVGIVFAVKGRKTAPAGKTGMATAGLVLAIIGTVLSGIGFISCTICATCLSSTANEVARQSYYW